MNTITNIKTHILTTNNISKKFSKKIKTIQLWPWTYNATN